MRYPANTIEEVQKLLLSHRDNMRVRTFASFPLGQVAIHLDLEPRLSGVKVERSS